MMVGVGFYLVFGFLVFYCEFVDLVDILVIMIYEVFYVYLDCWLCRFGIVLLLWFEEGLV